MKNVREIALERLKMDRFYLELFRGVLIEETLQDIDLIIFSLQLGKRPEFTTLIHDLTKDLTGLITNIEIWKDIKEKVITIQTSNLANQILTGPMAIGQPEAIVPILAGAIKGKEETIKNEVRLENFVAMTPEIYAAMDKAWKSFSALLR